MTSKIPYVVAAGPSTSNILDVAGSFFRDNFLGLGLDGALQAERFVAFVPAISTYAFLPDFMAPFNPTSHIFDLLDRRLLQAAASGKCLLVFDTSSEGDPLVEAGYENFHQWLDRNGISRSSVVVVNQNRSYASIYHEKYGSGVSFLVYDSYIKRILSIFASDEDQFFSQIGFKRSRITYRAYSPQQSTFLSLNGAPRANRLVAIAGLQGCGLLSDTVWSMLGEKSGKLTPSLNDARSFRSKIGLEWISDAMIEGIMSQMPRFISVESQAINSVSGSDALALRINPDLFDLAFCSIATETEFTNGSVKRISELSLKPIMMGHPMVSVGNPGSLQLLRNIGFQTFSPCIDETYDTIEDPGERLSAIYEALGGLQGVMRSHERRRIESELKAACEYNIDFAAQSAIPSYERAVEHDMVRGLMEAVDRLPGAVKT